MRYAILSDIHANLAAFRAVTEHLNGQGIDEVWNLGDIVGYGPYPNECLELLRSFPHINIAGNHDWGSIGKIPVSEFNREAAFACQWTETVLKPGYSEYLKDLPETQFSGDFTMAHGSPRRPIWEYIMNAGEAVENLPYFKTPVCLVGHSHIPFFFRQIEGTPPVFKHFEDGEEVPLGEGRCIINPGSVGQPRDGDPRGSYVIYDAGTKKLTLNRIPYDISQTQQRMRQSGLPHFLIDRLNYGR
jgi:predicted phosphodiesterase